MFSCDYNGWTDLPEEEREALESFEAANPLRPKTFLPRVRPLTSTSVVPVVPQRRAA